MTYAPKPCRAMMGPAILAQAVLTAAAVLALRASAAGGEGAAPAIENDFLRAQFDARGLAVLHDKASGKDVRFSEDGFSVFVGNEEVDSEFLTPAAETPETTSRSYLFRSDPWRVKLVYELRPGWRFITKQVHVSTSSDKEFRARRLEIFRGQVAASIAEERRVRDGALLRFAGESGGGPGHGLFLSLQCPFLQWKQSEGKISAAYAPDVPWKPADGPFESERLCLGPYALSGFKYSAAMVPEWQYLPAGPPSGGPTLDAAEVDALTDCVRAFLLYRPSRGTRVHIPWCENDYQIDVGTAEGREEYKRIIDRAAALGCRHVLFTPANSQVSSLEENRDAWGWENILWLGLGQKIRKGEWDPARDAIPASVGEMIRHAKAKGVRFLAYAYPSLPFLQDPAWTSWVKGQSGGYLGADTGQRSFQDWFLDKLVGFCEKTGTEGYSFDHWWIAYEETPSSKYAQWAGCRRILHELRKRVPDAVIDGRQQYHHFGVWTWLAGSYPHPLNTDEQPQSFKAFPDLHWDRVSADRQRNMAWWYRVHCFTPPEILPGYITHQTPRLDAKDACRRDRYRARDWDYLGWRYSLISSIATAPFQHVVNMIPARDPDEFNHFPEADQEWFRDWLDWADTNLETLRRVRPILGQPMVGRADGTAAFNGDRGFIFLFNPNYRPVPVELKFDASIGLEGGGPFLVRVLYPEGEKGKVVAPPDGASWKRGADVALVLPGAEAFVLEVGPAPARIDAPLLLDAPGRATLSDGKLELSGVRGECGHSRRLRVLLPEGARVDSARVNGKSLTFERKAGEVDIPVRFAGVRFDRCQQIGEYDAKLAGGAYRAEISIPARVFRQLEERKRLWPIPYDEEELLATWTAPHRLLLFVNVADPVDTMVLELQIDGRPVELKRAYTSVHPQAVRNTFVGWYADVSTLVPDAPHAFDVRLPALAPGQFQGLFLDNVEAEFTSDVVPGV